MKAIVEVKSATGEVREGISNGRGWKMATQMVSVLMPGADFGVPGKRDIYIPKDRGTGQFGNPEWMRPGRYEVSISCKPDKFGTLQLQFDWRSARVIVSEAPKKAA